MITMTKTAKIYFLDEKGEKQTYKAYHYLTLIEDLEENDLVVVETRFGYKVAAFGGYIPESTIAVSYIVQKVEVASLEKEKEKAVEMKELKLKIRQRAMEIQERKKFEALASEDKNLRDLLELLDEMEK